MHKLKNMIYELHLLSNIFRHRQSSIVYHHTVSIIFNDMFPVKSGKRNEIIEHPTVCGKKNREKTFARSFFKVFWPCGRPHAQNKKSGTSRSLCCQIFSSVRRLELKKTKKNENCGNRQNIHKIDKNRRFR